MKYTIGGIVILATISFSIIFVQQGIIKNCRAKITILSQSIQLQNEAVLRYKNEVEQAQRLIETEHRQQEVNRQRQLADLKRLDDIIPKTCQEAIRWGAEQGRTINENY